MLHHSTLPMCTEGRSSWLGSRITVKTNGGSTIFTDWMKMIIKHNTLCSECVKHVLPSQSLASQRLFPCSLLYFCCRFSEHSHVPEAIASYISCRHFSSLKAVHFTAGSEVGGAGNASGEEGGVSTKTTCTLL